MSLSRPHSWRLQLVHASGPAAICKSTTLKHTMVMKAEEHRAYQDEVDGKQAQ